MRKPPNERERLARLRALNILDPALGPALQSVSDLAAQISNCSAAYISFLEESKQLLRVTTGFTTSELPRETSVCSDTILSDTPLIIEDLAADPRFNAIPLATEPIAARFYAGFPLVTKDNLVLGTLCVVDTTPQKLLPPPVLTALTNLSQHIVSQLELHNKLSAVQRTISSLEDSEQRFRRIADASPVLLWISDQAGNRTLSNKAWCDFTGLSQEESLAECWRESVHPSDRAVYQAKWAEVAKGHNKFQHEYRLRHVSGTYRWVMEQAIPLFSSSGRLEAYVSSCVDLSLRSSDELQYQHNEARFRAVSEAAPLGIVVTDSNGNCIYSNQRFQDISGLTIEGCLGSGWLRRIHPEDFQGISEAWAQANKTARSFEHILRYERSDGNISWCSLKAATINATDTVSGWVTTVEDITAKRHAEEELIAAKQDAESAMHAKSQFLANMSHEIRTPLTAIIGFADALREEAELPPPQQHCLDIILKNGKHLLNIINQILDLAKIDAGALSVERTCFSIIELLEELRLMFAPTAAEKSLTLEIEYQWPLPRTITTDPLRFKQILINLIGNAIKFTAAGNVCVAVKWSSATQQIICSITDTGIGLRPEEVANLFKPFYQANESTTRSFGGTGLGLSISQRLIKALGGSIDVCSQPGQGSTFTFSIQCEVADETDALQQSFIEKRSSSCEPHPHIPRLSGSILFADDALDNRRLVEHLLRKTGADVTLVENGLEAAHAALAKPFDLILMDIQMPLVDGLTATRQLRAAGIQTPVIAVSAGAMTSDIERALEAGCTQHLSKPFDRRTFYEILTRFLQPRNEPTTPTPANAAIFSTVADDDEEMRSLIHAFIRGLPERLSAIGAATNCCDWSTLAAAAHKLKGSAGMYGFPELASHASGLEKAAKSTDKPNADLFYKKLICLAERIQGAVEDSMGEGQETSLPTPNSSGPTNST
jgi:PAS domain S-box-containing protein